MVRDKHFRDIQKYERWRGCGVRGRVETAREAVHRTWGQTGYMAGVGDRQRDTKTLSEHLQKEGF